MSKFDDRTLEHFPVSAHQSTCIINGSLSKSPGPDSNAGINDVSSHKQHDLDISMTCGTYCYRYEHCRPISISNPNNGCMFAYNRCSKFIYVLQLNKCRNSKSKQTNSYSDIE